MITKQQAETMGHGTRLYFSDTYNHSAAAGATQYRNYNGSIQTIGVREEGNKIREMRVTGKVKTWKTRPEDFKIPVKYGLYQSAYVGNVDGCEAPDRFFLDRKELEKLIEERTPPTLPKDKRVNGNTIKKRQRELNTLLKSSD